MRHLTLALLLLLNGCSTTRKVSEHTVEPVADWTAKAAHDVYSPPKGLPRQTRNVSLWLPGGGWLFLDNQVLFGRAQELPGWKVRGFSVLYLGTTAALAVALVNGIKHNDNRQTNAAAAGLVAVRFSDILTGTRAAMRYEAQQK